jgi:hypothetical protein
MTCRKGRYCIACQSGLRGIWIEEKTGYIIDDKFGFTKNEQGCYRPTEIETGGFVNAPEGLKYSLVQSYQSVKRCFDEHPGTLEAYKRKGDTKKAMKMIAEYWEKSNDTQEIHKTADGTR